MLATKKDFPVFKNNPGLIYLDSAATSLKPKSVIEKITEYYSAYSANVFRGVYRISEKATDEFETARRLVAELIGGDKDEIIFTRNTTEAINLVAYSLGRKIIDKDDEIILSIMEHHANFVPWQALASETGAKLKILNIDDQGFLECHDNLEKKLAPLITRRTKIVSLVLVSNVLGTINPVLKIFKLVKKVNSKIINVVDAAQAVPHQEVNVRDLGADFLAFSSHKMLGPTGVGVLWGKKEILKEIFPFNFGGEMIETVTIKKTTFKKPPHKFEAGTPAIGEVIGLGEAIRYLKKIGLKKIADHERTLTTMALRRLKETFDKKITIFGPADPEKRAGIISFTFSNFHPHDIASILDKQGIAVRAGHHCAMPLHQRLGQLATTRVSFYLYNDLEDIEHLIDGLKKVETLLGK
ncbi:MAG: SufS family cysteine desulfurase [Patescibacteria group bacterium]|nr:SufS family cysteine desulfurase [Patescibacteria group bacterium]